MKLWRRLRRRLKRRLFHMLYVLLDTAFIWAAQVLGYINRRLSWHT